jgi:two-component system alkaline phosphatase synthesis response regulator PhoP
MTDAKQTILVVDDEPGALILAGIMLERAAFSVLKASSAQTARETLEQQTPHLILLDITLPDRNGIDVCVWIRQQPALEKTPVIMLSGLSDGVTIERCKAAGANDFLIKPIRYTDLLAKLRAHLDPQYQSSYSS